METVGEVEGQSGDDHYRDQESDVLHAQEGNSRGRTAVDARVKAWRKSVHA
jgi:hypothetical protein